MENGTKKAEPTKVIRVKKSRIRIIAMVNNVEVSKLKEIDKIIKKD